ncbi:hypothetical protein, partial [Streptomyces chryseus]|uniref:hypothetical protein n=1 Tax=Streptomyces chryseus TaxID=68186 RepID=UPI00110F75C3
MSIRRETRHEDYDRTHSLMAALGGAVHVQGVRHDAFELGAVRRGVLVRGEEAPAERGHQAVRA